MDLDERQEIISILNSGGVSHLIERIFLTMGIEAYQDDNGEWYFTDYDSEPDDPFNED